MGQMDRSLELYDVFSKILGSENVYYQPPESIKMQYPCIVYERSYIDKTYADNIRYIGRTRYQFTLIDADPDSEFLDPLIELPYCQHDRHFVSDGLNHDVFSIWF